MFCGNCGKQIADGTKFCGYCGAPQPEMPTNSAPVNPTPVQQVPVQQAPVQPTPVQPTPAFQQPVNPYQAPVVPKKPMNLKFILSIVSMVVFGLVVLGDVISFFVKVGNIAELADWSSLVSDAAPVLLWGALLIVTFVIAVLNVFGALVAGKDILFKNSKIKLPNFDISIVFAGVNILFGLINSIIYAATADTSIWRADAGELFFMVISAAFFGLGIFMIVISIINIVISILKMTVFKDK